MKYKIGQNVICKPLYPTIGYLSNSEFLAIIIDVVGNDYICEDQDSDCFSLKENEIELNTES